jgi:hypothetical protein
MAIMLSSTNDTSKVFAVSLLWAVLNFDEPWMTSGIAPYLQPQFGRTLSERKKSSCGTTKILDLSKFSTYRGLSNCIPGKLKVWGG